MLFLQILLLTLATLLPQEDARWQRVKTDDQLSFLFPNHPQTLKRMVNGIPSNIYQTKDLACVFGVVCSDFSSKKIQLNEEYALLIYEELKKGSISMETAILKNEQTVPYGNMLIKEIEYSIIKDNYEMTYFKRFIFRDQYIYQISIGGRSRHRNIIEEERDIFFNSLLFSSSEESEK